VHSGIFIPRSSLSDLLALCLYRDTRIKGKFLAQRYMPRNKVCNFNKPNCISVRARIIRSMLSCAIWRHANWWTDENTDVSEKSVLLTFYLKKGDVTFLQNSYAKLHGVTSQMTVILIVVAKITPTLQILNDTRNWESETRWKFFFINT
jgi:hypothetical protein